MTDTSGAAGSQAGQQGSGSQAGQSNTNTQQDGSGSQAGQSQQAAPIQLPGMLDNETVEQAWERITGALTTSRKQAANYRQRLQQTGITDPDTTDQSGSGSQAGQSNRTGQQGDDDRIARLERELRTERDARRADRMANQLLAELAKEGAINPERAMRLIDTATLQVGDDGTIDDPTGAVRQLKSTDPYLFSDRRGTADGSAGNNTTQPADFNTVLRRRAGFAG